MKRTLLGKDRQDGLKSQDLYFFIIFILKGEITVYLYDNGNGLVKRKKEKCDILSYLFS